MKRIIDSHAHLGDIFHENKNISFKTNVKKGDYEDRFIRLEESGFTLPLFTGAEDDLEKVIDGGQFRCWESTLEQLTAQLDESDMAGVVLLPCLPNTTFEEYLAASMLEPRIFPFTGADFSLHAGDMVLKLKKDIERGAKGLKLHPILQNVRLLDERMAAAAEVFWECGLPVLTHVGIGQYYHDPCPWPVNNQYGDPEDFFEFCNRYPGKDIIGAHMAESAQDIVDNVKDCSHVYADTSFCSAEAAREAVSVMGAGHILFGTDYPFTHEKYNIDVIEEAFADDPETMDLVFYGNIARLLHI
ncbi:MAG: amidohydrolase family protein [Clostridiales bacterium]|nr:amidohydrolase family protein [Clostridiales bacterium]